MIKRLTAVILLLTLGAAVASGAPLRSGREECHRVEAVGMTDCSKLARSHGDAPEIQAARLCCAVNCQNGGTSGPASASRTPAPRTAPSHPAALPPQVSPTVPRRPQSLAASRAKESPPVYLLKLALLI